MRGGIVQAVLAEIPRSESDWSRWSWHHVDSHRRIIAAISAKGGPSLTAYILDPIFMQDFQGFLERNALSHFDMNAAIGAQGAELDELDPRNTNQLAAWIQVHWLEHVSAEQRLGL